MAYAGPQSDLMFSVTAWNCATGYYSFGHAIGRNMGCNKDKGSIDACGSKDKFNYGWRDPNAEFRSILASDCDTKQCDNMPKNECTRVQ
ncbi:hypothetical protein ACHAXH_000300, partial [Discostella pseudostelligera]